MRFITGLDLSVPFLGLKASAGWKPDGLRQGSRCAKVGSPLRHFLHLRQKVHENLNSDLPPLHGRQKQLTDVGEIGGAFGDAILDDGGRELVSGRG